MKASFWRSGARRSVMSRAIFDAPTTCPCPSTIGETVSEMSIDDNRAPGARHKPNVLNRLNAPPPHSSERREMTVETAPRRLTFHDHAGCRSVYCPSQTKYPAGDCL